MSVAWMACFSAAAATAQQAGPEPGGPQSPPVAVLVNGDPIYVTELEANYHAIASQNRVQEAQADQTKAAVLDQLVNRRLVLQALERAGDFVDPGELDKQLDDIRAKIKEQNQVTLEQYAQMKGVTVDSFRKELVWRLGWERYLDRHLANALEEYFKRHKKDLDGTEVRASHILLRPEKYNETPASLEARAKQIRQEIESGQITFEDAARKYSAGPSRAQGGDLGYVKRRGAMLDDFGKVAFALEVGEISQPLTTVFGTHLIRVTDIKPGTRQWTEVISQIRTLAAADLFEQFANEERANAKIEYTGKTPHFKPGTNELVVPPAGK